MEIIRGHWDIENRVHYVKDVTFNEDRRRYTVNPAFVTAFRSFIITLCRIMGFQTIPDARRYFALNFDAMLSVLKVSTA